MSKPEFELIYWPGIPGRGEFIRLLFEATGTPYTDTADAQQVLSVLSGDTGSIPLLAAPLLRHDGNLLSQTPAIIGYLAPLLGLAPEGFAAHQMNALVLTVLDFANEVHNTHHPVGVSLYYEDQLPEAKRYAEIFRKERVAKFFGYFERVLQSAATAGKEGWLLDGKMTAADLVLWQVVDGMKFAFPKATARVLKECPALEKHHGLVKGTERIKEYLASERRRKYSHGMFRHYPELDDQEGEE